MIMKQMDVDTVWSLFKDVPLPLYHDASPGECTVDDGFSF